MAVTLLEKQAWSKCNSMISSYTLNPVSAYIIASAIYRDTTFEVWNAVKNFFSQANGPRISQLQKQISTVMQVDSIVMNFFIGLQTLWDPLLNFRHLPCRSCGKCTYGVNDKINNFQHQDSIMQFIDGLNNSYSQVRTQILTMEPIPSIDTAFSLVIQEERQRSLGFNVSPLVESTTFAIKNQGFNKVLVFQVIMARFIRETLGKARPMCNHYGKLGHIMEKSFKLVGYPFGYKQKGRPAMANQVSVKGD